MTGTDGTLLALALGVTVWLCVGVLLMLFRDGRKKGGKDSVDTTAAPGVDAPGAASNQQPSRPQSSSNR